MKRIGKCFLVLTLCALQLPVLFGCGEAAEPAGADVTVGTTAAVVEENGNEPVTTELQPALDGLDFNGATCTLLIPSWSLYTDYYVAEEMNGDVLNDAIYERKLKTEEALNVTLNEFLLVDESYAPISQIYPRIQQSVLAGASDYDLVMTHCITGLTNLTAEHLLIDWNTVPNVDFSMPWWNSMMNETMSVNGQLYFAASDYILPDPNAILFNKQLAENYSVQSPYELVLDGKWTLDKLTELSRLVSGDLDGNGVYDDKDLYGYAAVRTWTSISIMYACDQFMLKDDGDGMKLAINNEKMVSIVQKYYDLLFGAPSSYTVYTKDAGVDLVPGIFDSGRALFTMISLNEVKQKREIDIDFGILPFPKYDENQERYISNNWAGLMVVPLDAKDVGMTGAVAEFMGWESSKTVVPVYYDVLLNTKFSRDEESRVMLDIIFSNSAYDIGMCYSNFNRLFYTMLYMMNEKTTDFASYYAKEEKAVQADYDKAFASYYE